MAVKTQRSAGKSRKKEAPVPVGAMVRDLRMARGMTIAELAERIDRSVGYVSQIERDMSGLSIGSLQRIAEALSVGINWFFQGQGAAPVNERHVVVRKDNRRTIDLSANGVMQELLSPTLTGQLELMITRFQPFGRTGGKGRLRKGEEAGLILAGQLALHVDGECFNLETGDSYSLRHKGRHRFENTGDTEAVLLCVVTPPDSY